MTDQKEITIFYSWQSDLPDETNRSAIRKALRKAINKVEEDLSDKNIVISLDEATRNVSGSPNIPATIIGKIEVSDIFVGDVSIINATSKDVRFCPNPNVVYELGFATAVLGWERIIMLFNTKHGDLSTDLPFDFDRHRVSPYKIDDKNDTNGQGVLTSLLTTAIKSVVENDPERASDQKGLSAEEKKRLRDQSNIKWALSALHIPTIDDYVENSPYILMGKTIYFWEGYNGVMTNSLFHLYDKKLETAFRALHSAWGISVGFGHYYYPKMSGDMYIFSNSGDAPLTDDQQKAWDCISEANIEMRKSLDSILSIVRENYLDIDIEDVNKHAWREYVKSQKEIAEALRSA